MRTQRGGIRLFIYAIAISSALAQSAHASSSVLSLAAAPDLPGLEELDRSPARESDDQPARDPKLLKRLTTTAIYETRPGDTLKSAAYFLYGHKSWWIKIRKQNRKFKKYNGNKALPVGYKLKYRAPKIGEKYVVEKNDWLIRIAQWKYGSSEQWKKLYASNAGTIRNPDLIHPGDRLILKLDGTIQNLNTGQVLVQGVPGSKMTTNPFLFKGGTSVPVVPPSPPQPSWWEDPTRVVFLIFGFLLGLFVLLMIYKHQTSSEKAKKSGFFRGLKLPKVTYKIKTKGRRAKGGGRRASYDDLPLFDGTSDDDDDAEIRKNRKKKEGEPSLGFRRRPLDEYKIDSSIVPDTGDDDLRSLLRKTPGYHSIVPKRKKRYVK